MSAIISRLILKIFGWKTTGWDPHSLNKYVVIALPHTSNWDFPLGLLTRSAAEAWHIKYIGKSTLFRPPFGWIFRALGGYPVDRSKNSNLVTEIVEHFKKHEKFAVTIAPEGTRKRVDTLKTGFYYIALGARVPIVMIKMDFGTKVVTWNEPFYPTGDFEKDILVINDFFKDAVGKNPELGYLYKK